MVDDGFKALVAHDMAVARGAADAVGRDLEADDAAIGALLDRHNRSSGLPGSKQMMNSWSEECNHHIPHQALDFSCSRFVRQ